MKPVIGIVGSSYSQGNQPYISKDKILSYTKSFEEHLKNYYPDIKFINVSFSGKGSERYLHNLIHLKEDFDITHLLIENIEDRSINHINLNHHLVFNLYNQLWKDPSLKEKIIKSTSLTSDYSSSIINRKPTSDILYKSTLNGVPIKKVKNFVDVLSYKFHRDYSLKIFGFRNVENTIKLCNILKVKPINWSHRPGELFYNDFGISVKEYIEKNWSGKFEEYSCDGTHCNDYAIDRLCKEYFKVIIDRAL